MTDINILRKNLLLAIIDLEYIDGLESVLPSPSSSNFGELMDFIIKGLIKEESSWLDMMQEGYDLDECLKELDMIKKKIAICRKMVEQSTLEEQVVEEETSECNIVFGHTPAGNNSFLQDVKKIDPHYYQDIIDLLNNLLTSNISTNEEKGKKLYNNYSLRNIMELKGFQIRIIYKHLPENVYYVMQGIVKKDDNPKTYLNALSSRCSLLGKDYDRVKSEIINGRKGLLLEESSEELGVVLQYLEDNKVLEKSV